MRLTLDPRFTFETFVVGPGNRMAAAAARRAAESPGTSYNPLFLHGGAGTGKTHLLHAVAALARAVRPELPVALEDGESLADRVALALGAGELEALRDEWARAGLLVLDDAHRLAGKGRTQEALRRLWDELLDAGVQLVVAADRAPGEVGGLDAELAARFSGGLTVDLAPAEPETRVGIVRAGARVRELDLADGAAEAVARMALNGGHGVHGALDRVEAAQAREGRLLEAAEVEALLAHESPGEEAPDEFGAFLSDIAATVEQLVEAAPWRKRLAEAILRWEGEGVRTRRLEAALDADAAPDVDALLEGFEADVARLREVATQMTALDGASAGSAVLRDPDRLPEAEAMLLSARAAAERRAAEPAAPPVDRWFLSREKVAWGWLALDDRIVEELG